MMDTSNFKSLGFSLTAIIILLASCSGGGGGGTYPTGFVSAPGGSLAFNPPGTFEKLAMSIFGKQAIAGVSGVVNVGSGVEIELIEVDASGNKVGSTIVSTTTNGSGHYTLAVPASTKKNSKYVIRAKGTTESMDVRFTGNNNDINPVSKAISDLVTTTASDLSDISTDEILDIKDEIDGIVQNIDPSGLSTAALATAIKNEVNANEEISNQLKNKVAKGSICGHVQDSNGNNLANIRIIARDFGEWVTRATAKTDSFGNYCLNVVDGDYMLGAINNTTTSMGASEWWHNSGTKYNRFDAEKITISSSGSVTKNFSLEAGARIQGKVTAGTGGSLSSGTAIEGVKIKIRRFYNFMPISGSKTNSAGEYVLNVIPGETMLEARNHTRFNYASEIYDNSTGAISRYTASKFTLTAGTTTTANFTLEKGYKLSGKVLDNTGGNPVIGVRVRINKGGPSFRVRTNKKGEYEVWLRPNSYGVQSHGQSTTVDMTSADKTTDFTAQVGKVIVNIKDSSNNNLSQVKGWLVQNDGTFIGQELTSSDGNITLYSPTTAANNKMFFKIDDDLPYGSTIYANTLDFASATLVSVTVGSTTNLSTTLPDAGTLHMTITSDGTTTAASEIVNFYTNGGAVIANFRSLSDGSFKMGIPAGTYRIGSKTDANCVINITAGNTSTNSYRTDSKICY